MIRNTNSAYGDPIEFENVNEMAATIRACGDEFAGITAEELREGVDYETVPDPPIRVIVPSRTEGADLHAPSHSKGYGRWRWVGQTDWSSAKYEGPAIGTGIEIEVHLRRASGRMDVAKQTWALADALAAERLSIGVPQAYEIRVREVKP